MKKLVLPALICAGTILASALAGCGRKEVADMTTGELLKDYEITSDEFIDYLGAEDYGKADYSASRLMEIETELGIREKDMKPEERELFYQITEEKNSQLEEFDLEDIDYPKP